MVKPRETRETKISYQTLLKCFECWCSTMAPIPLDTYFKAQLTQMSRNDVNPRLYCVICHRELWNWTLNFGCVVNTSRSSRLFAVPRPRRLLLWDSFLYMAECQGKLRTVCWNNQNSPDNQIYANTNEGCKTSIDHYRRWFGRPRHQHLEPGCHHSAQATEGRNVMKNRQECSES